MILSVSHFFGSYDVVIEKGVLYNADKYLDLNRRVLIVTDDGVPESYAKAVEAFCKEPVTVRINQGEISKNIDSYLKIQEALAEHGFTRSDCIVAVGGGVIGDISGFCASTYMRGIDFYNIPTTLLSQIDSSIGGKTAIDFKGYKNIIGAFYQPKAVLIDSTTLETLPKRHISNGLVEAVKMAATSDKELFEVFESGDFDIDEIIYRSLLIKKSVVENDERESGIRKVLNFGHTFAHAIESENMGKLYHGECVAIGMMYMCSDSVKRRLEKVLKSINVQPYIEFDSEKIYSLLLRDKKAKGNMIDIIYVDDIGSYEIKRVEFTKLKEILK